MSVESALAEENPDDLVPVPLFGRLIIPVLPVPATPLIGREEAVGKVVALANDPDVRLITLTGPGGIGKTRLVLAAARELTVDVAFIPLAAVAEPGLIAATIAQVLGIEQVGSQPPQVSLRDALRDRPLVLVLDNFEHLVAGVSLVSDLIGACVRLTVLVTSRVRLAIAGEHVIPVEPLTLPDVDRPASLAVVAESDAVRLFVERTRTAQPSFVLTEHNAAAISTICRRLDGLPLAIELAAARGNLLSPQALAARLEHRLHLLTGGPRDAPARLQTMRATIAWSSDLLNDRDRLFWQRLGTFSGGFTADAAEVVGQGSAAPVQEPLATLESLIDHELLRSTTNADGEPRFLMLETTREYALEQLAAGGAEEATRQAHAAWFRAFAKTVEPGLMSPEPDPWFNRTEADIANIRSALGWFRDRGEIEAALDLAGSLAWFWTMPNYVAEGRAWFDELLGLADATVTPEIRGKALMVAGDLADWHVDYDRATELQEQALEIWRATGDQGKIAATLRGLGSAALDRFAFAEAEDLLSEAYAAASAAGDAWYVAALANLLGVVKKERGNAADAIRLHEEALRGWQEMGDRDNLLTGLTSLGWAQLEVNEPQRAWESFDAALSLSLSRKAEYNIAHTLDGFAALAATNNQFPTAARLLAKAVNERRRIGLPLRPPTQKWLDSVVEKARQALGAAAFAQDWSDGQALPLAEAIREARAVIVAAPQTDDGLSRREREVLGLLVEGASDHEIADGLFISRRTASKHVAAILEKLGATNRTAAATIAHRRGLI